MTEVVTHPAPRKRKLPTVGIYDPNYSDDPQFGNVSTLKEGWKRIHVHYSGLPQNAKNYTRLQCIIPECVVPTIDHSHIETIKEIEVPVIKNFEFTVECLNESQNGFIVAGLCDVDKFTRKNMLNLDRLNQEGSTIDVTHLEALFIANRPIVYKTYSPFKTVTTVSNLSQRGYIVLQNYINLFVFWEGLDTTKALCFNAYIDYSVCRMKYTDAVTWRSDFESMINPLLRYRVGKHNAATVLCSRGELEGESVDDPETFPDIQNSDRVYRVFTREPVSAITRPAFYDQLRSGNDLAKK